MVLPQEHAREVAGPTKSPLVNVSPLPSSFFPLYKVYDVLCSLYPAVDCGRLDAPSVGQVSWTTTFFGGVATYACFTGYILVGQSTRRCETNGFWSGQPPICQRKFHPYTWESMVAITSSITAQTSLVIA